MRAAVRARAAGRRVAVVYDSHEYTAGDIRPEDVTWAPVMTAQEAKYIPMADGVVTAVDNFADKLVEHHGLAVRPTVVRNMPEASAFTVPGGRGPGVRGRLGLGPEATLLVYPGSVTPIRGLDTAVRALPQLPETHLALLVGSRSGHVAELAGLAAGLGVAERFHLLDEGQVPALLGLYERVSGLRPVVGDASDASGTGGEGEPALEVQPIRPEAAENGARS